MNSISEFFCSTGVTLGAIRFTYAMTSPITKIRPKLIDVPVYISKYNVTIIAIINEIILHTDSHKYLNDIFATNRTDLYKSVSIKQKCLTLYYISLLSWALLFL